MTTKNTVTEADIDALLDKSITEGWIVWGREMHVSFMLESGFTVTGRYACVDPATFDVELGKTYCRNDAKNKLWNLEGYRLQNHLYELGELPRYGGYSPIQAGQPLDNPA